MKFKVFEGKSTMKQRPGFYFHVRSTNGKITLQSQHYPTMAHAFRAVAQVWQSFVKAIDTGRVLQVGPPPYTRDSLRPVKELPKLSHKLAKSAALARASNHGKGRTVY